MAGKKVFIEHCEHAWEFDCLLDGYPFDFKLENIKFTSMTDKQKDLLFRKFCEVFK